MFELNKSDLLIAAAVIAFVIGKNKFPELSKKLTDTMKDANKATSNATKFRKKVDSQVTSLKDDFMGNSDKTA